jgi:hypothetical protein
MSNLQAQPDPEETLTNSPAEATAGAVWELLDGHNVALGGPRGIIVTRTLPNRSRRMVGAWCFADSYGPHDLSAGPGMRVAAHPHTGLQTVSWLVDGEVLHRDSLGSEQLIRPGQLNLMTAGRGISHSEVTPAQHQALLHGIQLWLALPDADRDAAPAFDHHARLPVLSLPGLTAAVLIGTLGDVTSPARAYTPLVGADVAVQAGARAVLPLRQDFEHAVLVLAGAAEVDGGDIAPGPLLYLGSGRTSLAVASSAGARLMLLGGEPFEEQLVMWWNFVGRTHEDIVTARQQWMAGERFGTVTGPDGDPLPAPAMPGTRLRPRGRER